MEYKEQLKKSMERICRYTLKNLIDEVIVYSLEMAIKPHSDSDFKKYAERRGKIFAKRVVSYIKKEDKKWKTSI